MVYFLVIGLGLLASLSSGFLYASQLITHFNFWQWGALIFLVLIAFVITSFLVSMVLSFILAPFAYLFIKKGFNENMIKIMIFIQAGVSPILSSILVAINMKLLIHWVEMLPLT